jgi:hypothetical protein
VSLGFFVLTPKSSHREGKYRMSTFNQFIRVVSLVTTLSACGGGGGAGDTEQDTTSDQNINSGLSGRVYVNQRYEGWMVDLSSGNASQLPDKGWWDTGEYTGSGVSFHAYPNQDASELLLFVNNCFNEFNGKYGDFDCLSIITPAGDLIANRVVFPDGVRESRLSRDGNYVAIVYADESLIDPSTHISIYNRSFSEIVSDSTMRVTGGGVDSRFYARGLDWSLNGQLTYAYTKSIYITSPYSAEGVPILTLPDSDSPIDDEYPVPANPKFNPDGSRIAFQYTTVSNATLWVMNIDGTDLHQLAQNTADVGNMSYNNFVWSPDGKYILVQVGGGTLDPISGGVSNLLYAIPSDSRNVPVPYECDGANGVICVRTFFDSPQHLTRVFDPWSSTFEWIE